MSSLSLSWVIGSGENCRGGSKDLVKIDDVMKVLNEVLRLSGSITLDVIGGADIGPQSLQVETENGKFIFSLGEYDGEDYIVRTFTNKFSTEGQVQVLGNLWDAKMVCDDLNIVRKIFTEFVSIGDVSRELLS